ncbi:MAG: DUF1501 domain-containing protein [Armatimonadetes bacterium]|nr:DUF1501 domain-containing protein [Armatimonadota bacterium]
MNRRQFLKVGGLTLFALAGGGPFWGSFGEGGAPRFLPRAARAAAGRGRVWVVLFLRGGLDGLHAVFPYEEDEYYRRRPRLSVPRPGRDGGGLALDGQFALHPAMAALMPLYREGSLAMVHAVGTPDASRSHFEAQDYLELGGKPATRQGWLNRYLQCTEAPPEAPRGLSASRAVPTLLQGPATVASLPSPIQADLPAAADLYAAAPDPELRRTSHALGLSQRWLERLDPATYRPAVDYPESGLGEQLRLIASLLKAGIPLEAIYAEMQGFDTHARQVDGLWPGASYGLNGLLTDLAEGLAAFWRDLGPVGEDMVLITLTEFGRRLAENGSLGTDHGRASCCFLLGGPVQGGKVFGHWPGLRPENLFEGIDLPVTTDYRDLLMEIAGTLGCPEPETLFPGYRAGPVPGICG